MTLFTALPVRPGVFSLILLAGLISPLPAADLDDEKDLADQIAARFSPEEIVRLDVSGIPFQGLYRDSSLKNRHGAVIILHGRKSNQDAAELIHPLRAELPTHGWATLSISLPLAETNAESENFSSLLPESVGRLRAAVTYLKQKEIDYIALVGHDSGAWVALNELISQAADPSVKAVVLIDPAPVRGLEGFPVSPAKLSGLSLPVLELLPRREGQPPDEEVRERKTTFRKNQAYRQVYIDTPNERWKDVEDYLIQRVHGWLNLMQTRPRQPDQPEGQQDKPSGG